MPVIAIVNRSRFREKSCGGGLLWAPCSLSGSLTSLQMNSTRITKTFPLYSKEQGWKHNAKSPEVVNQVQLK
jgi:hypothetical protein